MEQGSNGPGAWNPGYPGVCRGVLYSPHRQPVLVASLPGPLTPGPGFSSLEMKKEFLATLLQEDSPAGRTQNLALVQNRWGKPQLLVDGVPGPGVSFSWSAGEWWAAVGPANCWIGVDAASPQEFTGAYPVDKVFRSGEWQDAIRLAAGNREEAAALLWSVKEAVVKARGCGYHFFGPRQIRIEYAGLGESGPCWRGYLDAPCPDPAPPGSREILPVASIRLPRVWLSVAWMQVDASRAPAPSG